MTDLIHRLSSRLGALLAAGASVLLAIGVVAGLTLQAEYEHEVDRILLESARAAQKLALRTGETFDRVNQTTLLVKYLAETHRLPPLESLRNGGVLANDVTRLVLVTDAQGFVTDSTSDEMALNLADEDDFKAHKRRADLDVTVGATAPNPLAGGHVIPVMRRVDAADGAFAGIVLATVDPEALTLGYSRIEARDTAVTVLGLDGVSRARAVGGRFSHGERLDAATVEARAREVQASRRPVKSRIDGVERFITTARVDRYPLLVIVAQDAVSALALYRHTRRTVLGWAAAIAALVVLAGAGLLTKARALEARDRELAEAKGRFQDLYDHAPCGYYSVDARGVFAQVNATTLAWLGCSREEVIGRLTPMDFFTAEGRVQYERHVPALLADGRMGPLDLELLGRDGSRRRISVGATAIRDAGGAFVRSRSVMHDVTELDRMRRLMLQANREQAAMLDSDLIGIVKLKDRVAVWKNTALDLMFGYAPGELDGQPSRRLYLDEASYEALGREAYPVLRQGGHYRTQLRLRRKDGTAIWVDMSGVLLSAETGESMWMMLDISAIKQHQEQAERAASHDALTGLPNRMLLLDRLQQAIALSQRHRTVLAVCFIDLDGFKAINDRHGHAAGDRLLQTVAARLAAGVRANDTVARLGGDEFVLLLTELHERAECELVLSRIREDVHAPVDLGAGRTGRVSASIGVAFCPHDGSDADRLLTIADEAMYRAKQAGRPARQAAALAG